MAKNPPNQKSPPIHFSPPHSASEQLHAGKISHVIPLLTHAGPAKHPIVELIHREHKATKHVDHRLGQVDLAKTAMLAWAGNRAFRQYGALSGTIGLNSVAVPNLRGMVLSQKWRVLFRHIDKASKVGEYIENIGYLAGLVDGIAESAPKIAAILDSTHPTTFKGLQLSALSSTIAQRALLGVIPAGAHLIYRSLEGWCMMAGLLGGRAQSAASQGINTLHVADKWVHATFRLLTDSSNQSAAVWYLIDLTILPRSK